MDLKCFVENCQNQLKFYCTCKENYIFSCLAHVGIHADEGDGSKHNFKVTHQELSDERKQYLLDLYKRISESIQTTHTSIMESISGTIKTLIDFKDSSEKFFRNEREEIQKIMEELIKSNKELIVPGINISNFVFGELLSYNESLIIKFNDIYKKFNQDINSFSELYKKHDEFYENKLADYKNIPNLDKNLYFFRINTKIFVEFNVEKLSLSEYNINVEENQGSLAEVCQIPGDKLFYYGSYEHNINTGYIINLKDHTAEKIPKLRVRSYVQATYFHNEVYIFCGHPEIANCDKFNLITKTWSTLANFPEGCVCGVSALLCKDFFILSYHGANFPEGCVCGVSALLCKDFFILSYHAGNKLYAYNYTTNTYSILTSSVENYYYNILFKDKGKYYHLAKSSYFISNEESLGVWTKAAKGLSESLCAITSKPVIRYRKVYFVSSHTGIIYQFDLDTETLSRERTY
ncbi:hypothetical protein SteCoe_18927 [Stentor coeruleus]|uniref:Uncharacterized protein n=1 Tax=Stentor coeruleus TaxID=5963 RepID=A0A1R2BVE6_9CILI|nr:hypothetical protein SteCoe_18927 [Stentor coeruleus]